MAGLSVPVKLAAATFPDLLTVTVTIDPTVDDRRDAAIRRAMEILLTRVTGRPQAAEYEELMPLIESAGRLVTSYGELVGDAVKVGFNGNTVQSELTSLNWPIWGAERPQLALWAVIDFGGGQRALLGSPGDVADVSATRLPLRLDEFREGILDELLQAADQRGLPMALPLLDSEDLRQMSFAGVWGGFDPLIMRASARYGADFALTTRASLTDLGLVVDWTLIGPDGRGQTLRTSTLTEGIDWVADLFAAQFSSAGQPRRTRIEVEGITTLADYGRIVNYLETVSILESVQVAELAGDVLTLTAAIRAEDSVLDRVFDLGGILEAAEPDPLRAGFGPLRRYRVTGRPETSQ